ncbi:alpha/beta hydrolase [Desertivirga brevis]|uniref:alpha/beta hydrolase n=1 Tax=Desertivirga brevis TaxID=2810310 RepID=UPI001A960121|nr:alpha/beta fold hydrolase [Pedobacter sp. SYSU D00873]
MYTHDKKIIKAGLPASEAKKAIIMIHGRGASAESIISLANHLQLGDAAIYAPQATNHSWYPYSFMAPVKENQPALDSALELIAETVKEIISDGIPLDKIYFLGFSQGACLSLEYVTRNAARFGGVIALTGGLIGQELNMNNYKGDFKETPVLITTGDPDPHVPVSRVEESIRIIEGLNAIVTSKVYKGRPHTIQSEEIKLANNLILI